MPSKMDPMLATLVDKPFDADDWLYEVKWDGYRAIAFLKKGHVEIRSRNNKSFNEKFYPVYDALKTLNLNVVIDGEIIVSDESGLANFGALQNWRSEADGQLHMYIFDLLWLDGYSLMDLPLSERRKKLTDLVIRHPLLSVSQAFSSTGTKFYQAAVKLGLEGIIAKKANSLYTPGARSKEWLKIKVSRRQEVVIGGYTVNEDSPKLFSSLLVGVFKNGSLHYTGKIGTGFSDSLQREMLKKFKPLIRSHSPFKEEPDINKPSRFRPANNHAKATWLEPKLVCEAAFAEMTSDGVMRHPAFEGMREDKKASEVRAEKAVSTRGLLKKSASMLHKKNMIVPAPVKERRTLLNPKDDTQVRTVNGHELKLTNLDKLYWPADKLTKRDLLNYYYQAAPFILPYLKDRPQSLNRHPNGIRGKSFYQKDVTGKAPSWIKTFPYQSEGDNRDKHFLVCNNEASLLYMASLGCIEMNPWSSSIRKPEHPTWCLIDLDPDNNPFNKVVEAALAVKKILDAIGVDAYPKTSGSTGMHIYIPLGAKYTYEQSKEFARSIVTLVHREIPSFTSIERATKLRKGKLYLDFLQNRPQATLAAPYSVRPKPRATVSAPLYWEEVKKGLQMKQFTMKNMIARIKKEGDIFKPALGKGINMQQAVRKLESLM